MSKVIAKNKSAYFDYEIYDELEVGVVLTGGEVKSIKEGKINLKESFVKVISGNLYLINANISKWKGDTQNDYDSRRSRKLLLKKKEFKSWELKAAQEGYTIIPLSIYLKGSLIKLKIGLGKGRKLAGKKRIIQERDQNRNLKRTLKSFPRV